MYDPEALRIHLGLEEIPVYFCEIFVTANTLMRVGIIGPQAAFGRDYKGWFQYQLLNEIPKECYKSHSLILNKSQAEVCTPR